MSAPIGSISSSVANGVTHIQGASDEYFVSFYFIFIPLSAEISVAYSNGQKKPSISLSSPNPRFEPKMECGPFARECCNLNPYWRAHCVLLDAGMRVRGGSM